MMKVTTAATAVALCVMSAQAIAQEAYVPQSDTEKFSYAIGNKIGEQIMQQFGQMDSELDLEAFRQGINVILSGQPSQMSEAEANEIIQAQQQAAVEKQQEAVMARKAMGDDFRATNKEDPDVIQTESGLQYKKLTEGAADGTSPTAADTVVVHYEGKLVDGTVFDSSYQRGEPATFPVNGVIPGWTEVLQLMKPGDKWSVVIPPELAYGERGAGGLIGPNETLLFDVELIAVQ